MSSIHGIGVRSLSRGGLLAALLAASLWASSPPMVNAQDNKVIRTGGYAPLDEAIDDAIRDNIDTLLRLRNDEGSQIFAVLPFAVAHEDREFGSDPADKPFGRSLGLRVERALQLHNPVRDSNEDALDLVLDAFEQLVSDGVRSFVPNRVADRKKVALRQFALAIRDAEKTKADVFLTGEARFFSGDRRLELQLMYFEQDKPDDLVFLGDKVVVEDLKNDLAAMSELGEGYQGQTLAIVARRKNSNQNGVAIDEKSLAFPVQVSLLYDNRPQNLETEEGASDESLRRRVAEPQEGQKVTIRLKNSSPARVSVVLMVNGKNTLFDQEGSADNCARWVLEPNKEYEVQGFYPTLEKLRKFRVLSDEESEDQIEELGGDEFAGLIHVYVFKEFASHELASLPTPSVLSTLNEDRDERVGTYSELARDADRGLISSIAQEADADLQQMKQGPVVQFGCMVIRYYEKNSSGANIADDL